MIELAFEIAFAAGVAAVALSFAGVVLNRASERMLVAITVVLALGAASAAATLGINLAERFARPQALVLAAVGLGAAAVAEGGLVALARGLRKTREVERLTADARQRLAEFLDAHAAERAAEVERIVAREQANAIHLLSTQERKLAAERRDVVARQADKARAELTEAVAMAQERLERRLAAWAADLDRGQRELEAQLAALAQRHRETLSQYDARLASDAERIAAASEEHRTLLAKLRADFARTARDVLDEARADLDVHLAERRRAVQEVNERLREREQALREQIEREEADARARLGSGLEDAERRQIEQLARVLDRAASRFAEDAERRFEALIRGSREKAAERLTRELDRAVEQFARSAEKQVSGRIAQVAHETAERLEARLEEIARSAESQQEAITSERLRLIGQRLDEALANAEERIGSFEAQLEIEGERRLAELERAMKAGGQREPI